MFRVFCRNLQHHMRTGDLNVCIVPQCQNSHLKSISNISESKNPPSITVDYLINSCGLPPETALSAAKKVRLNTTEKPDSVITLFKNQGLTEAQIKVIISKQPELLVFDPNKILKPKIEFLHDMGVSGPDLSKLLVSHPSFLSRSLQNHIIPSFNFLKSIVGTNDNIISAYKRSAWVFQSNLDKVLRPNIEILRNYDVPDRNISKFITTQPRTLMMNGGRFKAIVEEIKNMGFNSSSTMFVYAVQAMAVMSKSSWEGKLAVFQRLGLSGNEIVSMFKRQPLCMTMSKERILRGFEFFMEKLKWKPADIALQPELLMYNLERRIVPRCAVLKILNSKGVIKKKKWRTVFTMSNKNFLDRFVMKYHETIPEVVKAYEGEIEFTGFEDVDMI